MEIHFELLSGIICAAVGGGMEVSMNYMISLDTFEKIKTFINIATMLNYDLDLISGKYVVDGKSILGILSLDLANPVEVKVINSDQYPKELEQFMI